MRSPQQQGLPAKDVALMGDEGLGDAIANARGHASDHNHSVYVDDDSPGWAQNPHRTGTAASQPAASSLALAGLQERCKVSDVFVPSLSRTPRACA